MLALGTTVRTSGFSLIALLVVVAIIGLLDSVGNFEFLTRTLNQDIVSAFNELAARSKFSKSLTKASKCFELRDRYIRDMNLER